MKTLFIIYALIKCNIYHNSNNLISIKFTLSTENFYKVKKQIY
jgi:hypothetical protein